MALQPMLLLDELIRPGSTIDASHADDPYATTLVDQRLVELLNESMRVQVSDEVAGSVPRLMEGESLDGRSTGPLRLPYPTLWLEWFDDAGARGHFKTWDEKAGDPRWPTSERIGIFCQEIQPQQKGEYSYLIHSFESFVRNGQFTGAGTPTDRPLDSHMIRVDLDDTTGALLGFSGFNPRTGRVLNDKCRDISVERLWVGLMAIGLMNCRNVTTERHERPIKKSKNQRRPRRPKLDYHTIVLPGTSGSGGSGDGPGGVVAMHRVRGHFKTFTAESPLMGKHVGTYWWGWQVRGSRYNGATFTDYSLTS